MANEAVGTVEKSFIEHYGDAIGKDFNIMHLLLSATKQLPEVNFFIGVLTAPIDAYALKLILLGQALKAPTTLPTSYVSLSLIRYAVKDIHNELASLGHEVKNVEGILRDFKQLYDLTKLPKLIPNGLLPFPANGQDLREGISLEFRFVTLFIGDGDLIRRVGMYGSSTQMTAQSDMCLKTRRLN